MSTLSENLVGVQARLAQAAARAGRDPKDITLIGVSKTKPLEAVEAAVALGVQDLGENYAQELRDKAAAIGPTAVRWHFIGRIQRNKAKYIAPVAYRVHALETVPQAQALVARAPRGVDALVAVNVGREASKGGVLPEELMDRLEQLQRVEGLRVHGLMALPPYLSDPEAVAPYFEEMAALLAEAQRRWAFTELSMGMSHDFEVAIRYGATHVRVGTALFGARG